MFILWLNETEEIIHDVRAPANIIHLSVEVDTSQNVSVLHQGEWGNSLFQNWWQGKHRQMVVLIF